MPLLRVLGLHFYVPQHKNHMSRIVKNFTLPDNGAVDYDYQFENNPPRSVFRFEVANASGAVSLDFFWTVDSVTFVAARVTDLVTNVTSTGVTSITSGLYSCNVAGIRGMRFRKLGTPSNVSCDIKGILYGEISE